MNLYFDIDGVLLDYDVQPKVALLNDRLQNILKTLNPNQLVCVSNWTDIVSHGYFQPPIETQKAKIYELLAPLFSDRQWFLEKLVLVYDNDNRCRHINLDRPFLYIDDWADEYFSKQFGREKFEECINQRSVFLANHKSDGADLIDWLLESRSIDE